MITSAANRLHNFVVTLCPDGSEPANVQEAMMRVHRYESGMAFFTPDDTGYASKWRHPTPEELRLWLRKNGNFQIHLELHTKTPRNHEAITFRGTSERFFWSEFMTHRQVCRNASSARAIPYKRMREWIMNDPALPMHYGSNRPGMQAGSQIDDVDGCEQELLELLDLVYEKMNGIVTKYDLHKELTNRYSEPWAWINWTATFSRPGFHNMLNLRAEEHALPSYQRLAVNMARLYRSSIPIQLQPGEWHLPMVSDHWNYAEYGPPSVPKMSQEDLIHEIKWSVARSAWTSYRSVEDKIGSDKEAYARHDSCVDLLHATPCEHQNECAGDDRRSGVMIGYNMYRMMISGESRPEFDFNKLDTVYKDVDYVVKS